MAKGKSAMLEYLDAVAEFIRFLSDHERTIEEILSHMVLVVFAAINAEAISFRELDNSNKVIRIATWGMSSSMLQKATDVYDLNDKYPANETLRFRKIVWIDTLPDWGDEYPLLKDFPYTSGAKSFICIPIDKWDTPVAVLGIFCRDALHPNIEIEAFLKAVGNVFSMHLINHTDNSKNQMHALNRPADTKVGSINTELTERQLVILRLISEDRTNLVISGSLGYSESTIRQETMKIFAKLNCPGRKEAAKIYREKFNKS